MTITQARASVYDLPYKMKKEKWKRRKGLSPFLSSSFLFGAFGFLKENRRDEPLIIRPLRIDFFPPSPKTTLNITDKSLSTTVRPELFQFLNCDLRIVAEPAHGIDRSV